MGIACRVAGGNNSPEQLWQSMMEKKDASGEMPGWRWEPYMRRDVRNAKALGATTSRGYFLDDLEQFDAQFFGISPKEAEQIDPQQRLALEVTWEALEAAGIPPQSLSGSDTAVFMGVNSDDYAKLLLEDLPEVEHNMGIGTAYCGVPNRISYQLNLMGPSSAVDAACASGLVAVHHGRQAILQGESKVAIVGGVNALIGPGLTRVLDQAGATCSEGRCDSFDDSAHGYGRGEGVGIIILKNMEEAIKDNDNILSVLKGSAVAQDGRTKGIMAPNGKAQELVANTALRTANLDPNTVSYVEAHATSTPLGDPTEVSALAGVYGGKHRKENPCYLGSVKPNIGHLEAGAGAMGFIKAVMAVNKGFLPPQANLKKLNMKVDWDNLGMRVVQEPMEWPSKQVRRAGVSSYGYGGTVSHAIIEQYTPATISNETAAEAPGEPNVLLLSAPQERRLSAQAGVLRAYMSSEGLKTDLGTIASALALRRGHHDYRAALVVDGHKDASASLEKFSKGENNAWASHSRVLGSDLSKETVWVFSGHGAQWKEMGRSLINHTAFRHAIDSIDDIVQLEMGFSLVHAFENGDFESSDRVQVMTYSMQVGLIAMLRSKGLAPQAVIGHSVGELAASVASGALSSREGAIIVCRRARLYQRVMGAGAMVLVNLPFIDVQKQLGERQDVVAAIDASPTSCVVSGSKDVVAELAETWKRDGIKSFRVKTDIAFHSPTLDPLAESLWEVLSGALSPKKPTTKLYSTSLQDPRGENLRDVEYWVNNMVNPVHFTSAVGAAVDDGYRLFLEVSSHPLVSHSITENLMERGIEDYAVIPTLSRSKPTEKSLLYAIGQLHCKGGTIDWSKQMTSKWASDIPSSTWAHKASWRNIKTGPLHVSDLHDVHKHTLLGQRIKIAAEDTAIYTTRLDNDTKPFPGSHPLHGTEIVPAAALVNTFIHGTGASTIENIVLLVPVAINAPRNIQIVVHQNTAKITSRLIQEGEAVADDSGSWVTHTTAYWKKDQVITSAETSILDIQLAKKRIGSQVEKTFSIDYLDKVGVSAMGFPWAITEHWTNTKEMLARVDVAPDVAADSALPWDTNSWAPILDAATSVGSTLFFNDPKLRMPAQIDQFTLYTQNPPPKTGWLYVQEATDTALAVHVSVLDDNGSLLAKFTSMRFSEIEGTPGVSGSVESLVHQLAWPPAVLSEAPLPFEHAIFVSRKRDLIDDYSRNLTKKVKLVTNLESVEDLAAQAISLNLDKKSMIFYVPEDVHSIDDVPEATERFVAELLDLVKYIQKDSIPSKVFAITSCVSEGETTTALAQAPLIGLGRIIASELPDVFGGLIDTEDSVFPLQAVKYVRDADIIRINDGVACNARLRSLPREKLQTGGLASNLLPRPEGTYVITGGLGALGVEVADFLVEKGARRLVLVSRRTLPPRNVWSDLSAGPTADIVTKISQLEKLGASIHIVSVDMTASDAAIQLGNAISNLSLPPVLGIVHAAGVLEDQLVLETTPVSFHRVLSPKISGALALHTLFPPQTLDFFILFSSCGQLFGFPGQSSYASANAFLDTLAVHRRRLGDTGAIAFQWTSWRGMGMAASTDFINAELESKGITDITRDEAFRAWSHVARFMDIDHAVVLRSRAFDDAEILPTPILNDIAVRRHSDVSHDPPSTSATNTSTGADAVPPSGPQLRTYLDTQIRESVATVLQSSSEDVDSKVALSDLGIDSVMTVSLRRGLQQKLRVKVPPTLTWSHPTVGHLVGWFEEKMAVGVVGA